MNRSTNYRNVIVEIAQEIEKLKKDFLQLKDFTITDHADVDGLIISYDFKTHPSDKRGGWASGVPEPDEDGLWFYIDLHEPDSMAQIHTQPVMQNFCIGKKKLAFLILEGVKTKKVGNKILEILKNHSVEKCTL